MGLYEDTRERFERGMRSGRADTLKVISSVVLSRLRANEGMEVRDLSLLVRDLMEG